MWQKWYQRLLEAICTDQQFEGLSIRITIAVNKNRSLYKSNSQWGFGEKEWECKGGEKEDKPEINFVSWSWVFVSIPYDVSTLIFSFVSIPEALSTCFVLATMGPTPWAHKPTATQFPWVLCLLLLTLDIFYWHRNIRHCKTCRMSCKQ